jgi:hypothetical protein
MKIFEGDATNENETGDTGKLSAISSPGYPEFML